ncbi:hypothetical protein HMPREF9318_01052 [Streptococcus urinalis FB127-CNA-2]|uniref:SIS domain protein n=1 Tax=Streptococcus urinalis 2285-97 TaxID=764291 RepID=G5KHB5_9STRE|nr:MurR/RpiR family transcriptional regulator [Streptococcus urinalis]EHJ56787.1 SIS domain protein [Streptococcus urinalis 2285-97]EKS21098.1 hypothetical protein HMPREF9318_01052 [Streptococcus urinalis FB127-CNA-2]VEF31107.1 HTH-type transcriptional regulator [Streptococcus urinalis]
MGIQDLDKIYITIEEAIPNMTALEVDIATYFLTHHLTKESINTEQITQKLHVSPAALTRFAKKCHYSGYREFVYDYLTCIASKNDDLQPFNRHLTKQVLLDYDQIISKTYRLVDEDQLQLIAEMIEKADRVYFFGKGSSGLVAQELKLRFMRLGVICDAFSDSDSFKWAKTILSEKSLVIGFSISGETQSVIHSLSYVAQKGIKTVLLTTKKPPDEFIYSEWLTVASAHHLNYGNRVSPQLPLLIMIDILYAYFFAINKVKKEQLFNETLEKKTEL